MLIVYEYRDDVDPSSTDDGRAVVVRHRASGGRGRSSPSNPAARTHEAL